MFRLWFILLGVSFAFLDVGPSILFLVFSLFWVLWFIYDEQGFINNIQYWMLDSQSASQEGNMNSPTWWPVTEFSPQLLLLITMHFYSHN
jgi:hypothetical protein